jgi:hypothetical protein
MAAFRFFFLILLDLKPLREYMEELTYRQSPKHRKTGLVISIICTVSGALIISQAETQSWKMRLGFFIAIFGILVLLRVLRNKVMITVNKQGIKSDLNASGLISWSYIEGFEIKPRPGGLAIVAKINNPEMLLNEKSRFSRSLMKTNFKKFGSPVVFPDQFFHKPAQEVVEELENYRKSVSPGTDL